MIFEEIDYPMNYYLYGNSSLSTIPTNISRLFVTVNYDDLANNFLLDNSFSNLEEVNFASNSMASIRNITIDGVFELQSISFGRYSCRVGTTSRSDGWLTISNSPKLESIEIQNYALQDYSSVIFSNLSSLQTISIGSYAFQYSNSLQLTSSYIIFDFRNRSSFTYNTNIWFIYFSKR